MSIKYDISHPQIPHSLSLRFLPAPFNNQPCQEGRLLSARALVPMHLRYVRSFVPIHYSNNVFQRFRIKWLVLR
jgi:hypothetical protein